MFTVFFVLVFLGLVGVFAYRSHLAEKRRTEELQQVAGELGYAFFPEGDAALFESLGGFHLFSLGHSRKLWNLMRGKSRGVELAVFDFKYVTGGGKHSHTWHHSVIRFQFNEASLPSFSLRPENVFHKIGEWFGYQDIDFKSRPDFSSRYLVRGREENAIRNLFTDRVLTFYEQQFELSTEGAGDQLLVYRHDRRLPPEGIRSLLEEGFAVLSMFHPSAGQSLQHNLESEEG